MHRFEAVTFGQRMSFLTLCTDRNRQQPLTLVQAKYKTNGNCNKRINFQLGSYRESITYITYTRCNTTSAVQRYQHFVWDDDSSRDGN